MSTLPVHQSQSVVTVLGPELQIDLDAGVLIREREEIFLTAREVEVMRILVYTMNTSRRYLKGSAIAQDLIAPGAFDPEHCIEQTISVLRRKLGEVVHHPRILRGRRGFGYRLFPDLPQG